MNRLQSRPNKTRYKVRHYLLVSLHLSLLTLGLLGALLGNLPVLADVSMHEQVYPTQQDDGSKLVYLLQFDGMVSPVLDQYLEDAIQSAVLDNVELIVLQLDTPGGSVNLTNTITQKMLASPIPIAVYVAPSAARAGSAGTFLTLAGHVAAMAPGSSIGAASPVGGAGEDIGETMEAKVKNILSADIENLAARRGEEAVEWAIAAVQEAAAATADQALDLGVIDFIATDTADLLSQVDGFTVSVQGEETVLATERVILVERPLTRLQEFLRFLTDPTVASLLLSIGTAGLLAEVWNPGTWIPGVAGAICLLLGLYALGQLDANFAGLALMGVALALFIAEAFTPTFGALAIAGAIAFSLGGALLFDAPGIETPWVTILTLAVSLALFTVFAGAKGLAIQRRPTITGGEALIGQRASVRQSFAPGEMGKVFVDGEWWNAQLASTTEGTTAVVATDIGTPPSVSTVQPGDEVEIVGRKGYTLLVKK